MSSTADLIKSARPIFMVRGNEEPSLTAALSGLLIVENALGLYRCEATFGNLGDNSGSTGYLFFDRRILDFGAAFNVKIGQDMMFKGRIMALEANFPDKKPPEITVLAEDRLQDMRMTRRTRTFENMSDSDVINQIASDHGCTAQADLADDVTHKLIAQLNQSDLAFMRDRARSIDAELWIDEAVVHAQSRSRRSAPPIALTYQDKLHEFSVIADLSNQYSTVKVSGWDKASKAALSNDADASAVSSETGAGQGGASILTSAIGDRTHIIAHLFPENQQETQVEAGSAFKSMARNFVTGRGIAETDAALKVGATTDLQGLGPMFNGKYYVTEVRHQYDATHGFRTEIIVNRPFIGQ
jgi:phage protein D